MATDIIEEQLDREEFQPHIRRVEGEVPDDVVEQIATENQQTNANEPDELAPEQPMKVITKKPHEYFFKKKKFWLWLMILVVIGGILAWLIGPSREWLVNAAGQKATLRVLSLADAPGQKPVVLKNTRVTINDVPYTTNDRGELTVEQAYGDINMVVSKPGFASVTKKFRLDFDPFFYKLGGKAADESLRKHTVVLHSVGLPISFKAKDWLTGIPVTSGQFSIGDLVANPNDQGIVSFTIPATDAPRVSIVAKLGGVYIDRTFDVATQNASNQEVTFVPAGGHYFVSKRSTGYGLYRSNIDGNNVTEIIAGTANDTAATSVSVSPNGKYATLISSRSGLRDSRGIIQPSLYIVDLNTKKLTSVETAHWFKIADWVGDKVVYTFMDEGRQRLISLDAVTGKRTELANGKTVENVFTGLLNVGYTITDPAHTASPQLFTVALKGSGSVNLGNRVEAVTQPDVDVLAYRTADKLWHDYNMNTGRAADASAPANLQRQFLHARSQNGQHRLFIDTINGVPHLVARTIANNQDTAIVSDGNLRGPIRWVGNTIIFRKIDKSGAADYAVSAQGGTAKKIINITAAAAEEPGFN